MCRRTTFSVVFFCKKTKVNKKGKAPVYARITTCGQATEIYTQCQVEPEHWNQRLERCVLRDAVSMRINEIIASYRANILAAYYTREQYKKEDLPLDMISYEYIDGLNTFMQTAHQCKNNGAVNLLCCLKNFILYAIRNEWIEKNPFRYYKMKIDKTNVKVPLTKSELDTLIHKSLPNDRLDRIRDVFCFCCFTGLAFTDADNLRKEHITTDEYGTTWIHKPREKTAVMSRVPLLPHPIELLNKYAHDTELQVKGKLLPVPSNQKMNAYLKEIADLCNIPKNLTTHCRRHTFATMMLTLGADLYTTSKLLGHTDVKMTQVYAKIINRKKDEAVNLVNGLFD